MRHLTTLDELSQHITLLASVEETDAPFVSVYLKLEDGMDSARETLDARAYVLRRILKGNDRADFEDALGKIEYWLSNDVSSEANGVAVFARGKLGGDFMLPMQFSAPLPDWIVVNPTPNIYHLVELKDNYHRYIVVLATADRARILEVNLGAATIQAWIDQPNLRSRVGSEWTRSHYQVHQANRGHQFLHEKIAVLEQLMHAGGFTHLILAGDAEITGRIRLALPDDLVDILVDTIPAGENDNPDDIVMATMSSFLQHEEQESWTIAENLINGLRNHNLAVVGSTATLDALRWGEVDTVVMTSDYQPLPGWSCTACKAVGTETPETRVCARCNKPGVRPMDVREAVLRLAGQLERPVEIVAHSDALMSLGGVGAMLRRHKDAPVEA